MGFKISKTRTVTNTYEIVQTGKFDTYGNLRTVRGKVLGDETKNFTMKIWPGLQLLSMVRTNCFEKNAE